MSAWIVSKAHIDALVHALGELVPQSPDETGRTLWRENLASVAYRYPRDGDDGERPGPVDFRDADVEAYAYERPTAHLSDGAVLLALQCYSYQSCEHEGWYNSQAFAWTDDLTARLDARGVRAPIYGEPGYAWGLTEADVRPRVTA